jgi:transposase
MANKRKQFSPAFKQDAMNYYVSSGKSIEQAAKDLKIGYSTLNRWIVQAKQNEGQVPHRGSGNYASDIEKENAMLKRELQNHKDALDILKKAISILNR